MKVLHIIVGLNVGGAEMMLRRLLAFQSKKLDLKQVVLSLTDVGSVGGQIRAGGVEVHALNMRSVFDVPSVFWRLIHFIRSTQPDVVQTWMYHADFLGGVAARMAGSRAVVWGVRSTAIPQGVFSFSYWLIRLCALCSYFIPERIICVSKSAMAAHIKLQYSANKMAVIVNGYDFSTLESRSDSRLKSRTELGFDDADVVIGVVGRFDPLKDFRSFVTAASRLAAERSDVKFLMVGRGNEWANVALVGWIDAAGLKARFRLVGEQSDVPYYLSALDIFCLSSVNEAFPNVVVEAMAMGLPCVVTRAGDAADILGDGGFVVAVKDPIALADSLLRMCYFGSIERGKIGQRNAERVRGEYGIKKIAEMYDEIYSEIARR
jgi:glycosyltransferase involved in cell wall biosynthesis